MATFSTNQVRHVYVSKALKTTTASLATEGDLAVIASNGADGNNDGLFIQTMGKGGLTRSDLIKLDSVVSVNNTLAAKMAHNVKITKLALKSAILSSSNIADKYAGKDFIVRIHIPQYVGMSDEETMVKYGCVRAYSGMSASDFYKTLAVSIANNMSREIQPLVKVYLNGSTEVKAGVKISSISGTGTYITLKEVQQPWKLGVVQETFVNFEVVPATVELDGAEIETMDITDLTSTSEQFGNGRRAADLEYFGMGDRGDVYRNINWPYSIPSDTFLDGTGTYDFVDVTYNWAGPVEDVQKSRKQITIIAEAGKGAAIKSAIDAIVSPSATSTTSGS